jgi:hypothetical protein
MNFDAIPGAISTAGASAGRRNLRFQVHESRDAARSCDDAGQRQGQKSECQIFTHASLLFDSRRHDTRRSGRAGRKIDATRLTIQQLYAAKDVVAVTVREKTIVIANGRSRIFGGIV